MNECAKVGKGMDVIIVSTDCPFQEEEWQRHLEGLLGDFLKPTAKVVAVYEDWPGGAGNGLGTLYAYKKAQTKLKERLGVDLAEIQKKGAAVAIYHTAGQGKRLSPLTGSEWNNKAAVKLPTYLGKNKGYMTLLDAVLKQTAIFAPSRKGRLSVFWCDQLFIPAKVLNTPPTHHVEIFTQRSAWPDADQWEKGNWGEYGTVFYDVDNHACLLEKPTFNLVESLKAAGKLPHKMGKSLGCFTLSSSLTFALLDLFSEELSQKKGRYDSDPAFWMASTLTQEVYGQSILSPCPQHKSRMDAFVSRFCAEHPELPFFGALNVGSNTFWWDYGTVDHYFHNQLKLVELNPEGEAMRSFLGLKLDPNSQSIIVNSTISSSTFRHSVIVGSSCDQFEGEECVFINSEIGSGKGSKLLLYNVHEKEPLTLTQGTLRADAFIEERHVKLSTTLGRDGKADWSEQLPRNALSYEEVYQLNQAACRTISPN